MSAPFQFSITMDNLVLLLIFVCFDVSGGREGTLNDERGAVNDER